MLRRTALYEQHHQAGAHFVDFGGWEMPLHYGSQLEEHHCVRREVGLFDVSHMGEVYATGEKAFPFVQNLITNDVSKISDGQILYSPMCYEHGGIVDDLLVYKFSEDKFLIVVNASNIEKDFQWMQQHSEGANVQNHSVDIAEVALQGPKAEATLRKSTESDLSRLKPFHFIDTDIAGINCLVSRTGYTGEDGFEIYFKNEYAVKIWDRLLEIGKEYDIKPVGLGARDTLRLEMKYPLYGNDISEKTTPLEAGLSWVTKFDKGNFMGRESLLKQKDGGLKRKLIGFEMIDKGIPRSHYSIFKGAEQIGEVTSGTMSPSLNKAIGVGYVKTEISDIGNEIEIDIRGNHQKAKIVSTPFYKRKV